MAQFWNRLDEHDDVQGVFTNAVVPPAVTPGDSLLRTSYMATHTREHLDMALGAMERVGREMGIL